MTAKSSTNGPVAPDVAVAGRTSSGSPTGRPSGGFAWWAPSRSCGLLLSLGAATHGGSKRRELPHRARALRGLSATRGRLGLRPLIRRAVGLRAFGAGFPLRGGCGCACGGRGGVGSWSAAGASWTTAGDRGMRQPRPPLLTWVGVTTARGRSLTPLEPPAAAPAASQQPPPPRPADRSRTRGKGLTSGAGRNRWRPGTDPTTPYLPHQGVRGWPAGLGSPPWGRRGTVRAAGAKGRQGRPLAAAEHRRRQRRRGVLPHPPVPPR